MERFRKKHFIDSRKRIMFHLEVTASGHQERESVAMVAKKGKASRLEGLEASLKVNLITKETW